VTERSGTGRPTLLNDERAQRIVDAVTAGNYLKVAAQWAGVSERTLMGWLARGRAAQALIDDHDDLRVYCPECGADRGELGQPMAADPNDNRCGVCGTTADPRPWSLPPDEDRYLQFLHAVTRAETSAEVAAVTAWRGAFAEDWRAARDYLVRRRPDRWAATTRVQMTTEESERRIDDALDEALAALAGDGTPLADHDLDSDLAEVIEHDRDDDPGTPL
jgi:hypothetical protein